MLVDQFLHLGFLNSIDVVHLGATSSLSGCLILLIGTRVSCTMWLWKGLSRSRRTRDRLTTSWSARPLLCRLASVINLIKLLLNLVMEQAISTDELLAYSHCEVLVDHTILNMGRRFALLCFGRNLRRLLWLVICLLDFKQVIEGVDLLLSILVNLVGKILV